MYFERLPDNGWLEDADASLIGETGAQPVTRAMEREQVVERTSLLGVIQKLFRARVRQLDP